MRFPNWDTTGSGSESGRFVKTLKILVIPIYSMFVLT